MSYSITYADDYEVKEEVFDNFDDHENDENDYPAQNQIDGTDEDTEEASETDMGRSDEPMEIKEQMYQDKLASLKKQLQQLKDGTHPELNRRFKRLEHQYKERLRLNDIHRDYMVECVERDYLLEKDAAAKEFKEKKEDLKETLINDFEDKRKQIESDRHSMELTGDSAEVKPVMTRKLRRRPNDPIPVLEKRRKPPTAQLVLLLDEKEIESDLKIISRGKPLLSNGSNINNSLSAAPQPRKSQGSSRSISPEPSVGHHFQHQMPHQHPNPTGGGSGGTLSSITSPVSSGNLVIETRVEDGKLLYERRWFHRGQPVYVEGDVLEPPGRWPGNISSIGPDAIWVKKQDGSKFRICTTQLSRGKISIKRRAS